jgi:hypothetical protein
MDTECFCYIVNDMDNGGHLPMAEAARKQAPAKMTVADFLEWEDGTDTRYELV